jgi:hypothetical protein
MSTSRVDWVRLSQSVYNLTQQVLMDHLDDEADGKSAVDVVLLHCQRLDAARMSIEREMKEMGL